MKRRDRTNEYASPEWRLQVQRIKHRSGGTCERCKSAKGRHVHHLRYPNGKLGSEPLDWLQHVCLDCHEFYHPHRRFTGKAKKRPQKRRVNIKRHKNRKVGFLAHDALMDWVVYSDLRTGFHQREQARRAERRQAPVTVAVVPQTKPKVRRWPGGVKP